MDSLCPHSYEIWAGLEPSSNLVTLLKERMPGSVGLKEAFAKKTLLALLDSWQSGDHRDLGKSEKCLATGSNLFFFFKTTCSMTR